MRFCFEIELENHFCRSTYTIQALDVTPVMRFK